MYIKQDIEFNDLSENKQPCNYQQIKKKKKIGITINSAFAYQSLPSAAPQRTTILTVAVLGSVLFLSFSVLGCTPQYRQVSFDDDLNYL